MLMDYRAARAYQRQRYRDAGLTAEGDLPASRPEAGQDRLNSFYCQALIQVGCWMVDWGTSLQERYGSAAPSILPRSANRAVS